MFSKDNVLVHMDNVHYIIRIMFFQEHEDFKLNFRLIFILFFVFNYFECNETFIFVIKTFDCDSEGTFPQELLHFIPEADVIAIHDLVIALIVVVAKVAICFFLNVSDSLFRPRLANEVNLLIMLNFKFFELCEADWEGFQRLLRTHWKFGLRIVF